VPASLPDSGKEQAKIARNGYAFGCIWKMRGSEAAMFKSSVLILAALAWAAPLAAGAPAKSHTRASAAAKAKCPKAQAKAAQAKAAPAWTTAGKGGVATARTVAPRLSMPAEGSIFSLGRGSVLAP